MRAVHALAAALALAASAASAAPKTYVFTGKFTAGRGMGLNVPLAGDAPCGGVGLANLTLMSGPGGVVIPAPNTDPIRTMTRLANAYGCVPHVEGKKITTSGAGVGGAFVMPPQVFSHPLGSYEPAAPPRSASTVVQVATSFRVTGPAAAPTAPLGGSMAMSFAPAALHGFRKGAWMTQTGRQGSMFTWCWGNPGCAKITQGAKPLIVKYAGGGNAFGGTMAYVIHSGPGTSSLAIGGTGGNGVAFAILKSSGSRPTGRGYADYRKDAGAPGPVWALYRTNLVARPRFGFRYMKMITMVTGFLGNQFPAGTAYHFGFPFTTMTVLARNTGTVAGNPRLSTITAMGGDSVTAMGRRNLSLVAGGLASAKYGPLTSNTPLLAQMYLPEPSRAAQLAAGALALLGIAATRARGA
jgi:hypothetical protein